MVLILKKFRKVFLREFLRTLEAHKDIEGTENVIDSFDLAAEPVRQIYPQTLDTVRTGLSVEQAQKKCF